jgi:hypothetical protein
MLGLAPAIVSAVGAGEVSPARQRWVASRNRARICASQSAVGATEASTILLFYT